MMSGYGGHRGPAKGRFAGLTSNITAEEENLYILGLPLTLFRDDETAQLVEEGRHLQQTANCVLVDRFDVRLLLDIIPAPPPKDKKPQADRTEEQELDAERYRDLDPARELELEFGFLTGAGGRHDNAIDGPASGGHGAKPSDSRTTGSSTNSSDSENGSSSSSDSDSDSDPDADKEGYRVAGAAAVSYEGQLPPPSRVLYTAVGFKYDVSPTADAVDRVDGASGAEVRHIRAAADGAGSEAAGDGEVYSSAAVATADEEPYIALFAVPQHLEAHVPENQRLHRLLVRTARFVSDNGDQVEVLLRVRQANNPNFAFLLPGHRTFPYYRWVVETRPRELTPLNAAPGLAHEAVGFGAGASGAVAGPPAPPPVGGIINSAPDVSDAEGDNDMEERRQEAAVGALEEGVTGTVLEREEHYGALPAQGAPAQSRLLPTTEFAHLFHSGQGQFLATVAPVPVPPLLPYPHMTATVSAHTPVHPHILAYPAYPVVVQPTAAPYGPTQPATAVAASTAGGTAAGAEPPATTKSIIEKLVLYVAKNGITFESVVRQRERSNPAFSFLLPWGAHHSYYRRRLEQVVGVESVAAALDGAAAAVEAAQGASGEPTHSGGCSFGSGAGASAAHTSAEAVAILRDSSAGGEGATRALDPVDGSKVAGTPAVPAVSAPVRGEHDLLLDTGALAPAYTAVAPSTSTSAGSGVTLPLKANAASAATPAANPPKVVIRANPKLAAAAIRPPKPLPPPQPSMAPVLGAASEGDATDSTAAISSSVVAAVASTRSEHATRRASNGASKRRVTKQGEDLEDGEVTVEEWEGEEVEGDEGEGTGIGNHAPEDLLETAAAVKTTGVSGGWHDLGDNESPEDRAHVMAAEPNVEVVAAADVEEGTAATGSGEVIMVFERPESSSSGSEPGSGSESDLDSSSSDGINGICLGTDAEGDGGVRAGARRWRQQRRHNSQAPADLLPPLIANGSGPATATAADTDADARMEARRQAARLLVAKARAQQEVVAAAQRSRAIHHHRHFFLRSADEEDASVAPAHTAITSGNTGVSSGMPTAVAAALAVRSATATAATKGMVTTMTTTGTAEPIMGGASVAEVLALERLLERQKHQQFQLKEAEHQRQQKEPSLAAAAMAAVVAAAATGSALQPRATSATAASVAESSAAAAALLLPSVDAGVTVAAPSTQPARVAGTGAAAPHSSLLALRELVVAAAAAAAQHRAAFEAMLRDPAQVMRTERQEAAPVHAGEGHGSRDGGESHSTGRRRRKGVDARDGNGAAHERDHHRDRKRSKRGSRSRSRSRSRSNRISKSRARSPSPRKGRRKDASRTSDRKAGRSRSVSPSQDQAFGSCSHSREGKQRRRGDGSRSQSRNRSPQRHRQRDDDSPVRSRERDKNRDRRRRGHSRSDSHSDRRSRHKGDGKPPQRQHHEVDGRGSGRDDSDDECGLGSRSRSDERRGQGPSRPICTEVRVAPVVPAAKGGGSSAAVAGSASGAGGGAANAGAGDLRSRLRQLLSDGVGLG